MADYILDATKNKLGSDPYWDNVVFAARLTTDTTDLKGHTVGGSDSTSITTNAAKFGTKSLEGSSTHNYLRYNSSPDFVLGTGAFTIELWAKPTTDISGALVSIGTNYTNQDSGLYDGLLSIVDWSDSSGILLIVPGGSIKQVSPSLDPIKNSWNHITVSRAGSTYYVGLNGIVRSVTSAFAENIYGSYLFLANITSSYSGYNYTGFLQDVKVTKGVTKYTSDYAVPTQPFLTDKSIIFTGKGAICGKGYNLNAVKSFIGDYYRNKISFAMQCRLSNSEVLIGSLAAEAGSGYTRPVVSTSSSKWAPSSCKSTAITDGFLSNTGAIYLGDTTYTIEFWVYIAGYLESDSIFTSMPSYGPQVYVKRYSNGMIQTVFMDINSNMSTININGCALNTWHHYAICKLSANTFKAYLNGVGTSPVGGIASQWVAGVAFPIKFGSINGYMQDIRITRNVVRYTSNFTVPTTEFPVDYAGYTITGIPAFLYPPELAALVAAAGSYSINGIDTYLLYDINVTTETGSYTFSGVSGTLLKGIKVLAESTAFLTSGVDAASSRSYSIDVSPREFTALGSNSTLNRSRILNTDGSIYSINGIQSDGWIQGFYKPGQLDSITSDALTLILDDIGNNTMYIGKAIPGSSISQLNWQIQKVTFIGQDIMVQYAGDGLFNQVWTNRFSIEYT